MALARNSVLALICALPFTCRANGLCIYKGKLYAKTTIQQEFADSSWVVVARVTAEDEHWRDYDGGYDPWTIYQLQVVTRFKGNPPANIRFFTYNNSGGFYLDKGGEYLLFLDPISSDSDAPKAAGDATEVNYNCGQSKDWSEVSEADRSELLRLSTGGRVVDKPRKSN